MRVSEFCGLTKRDIDFKRHRIHVNHQLAHRYDGSYYVEKPKSERENRYIPMTDEVYKSVVNIISNRQNVKTEILVDGYSGFLLLTNNERLRVSSHIASSIRLAMKKYAKLHPDNPLSHITPHVFRHTFCTNTANAGMSVKTLQYLMGHSNVVITLNVYTHTSYEHVAEQMAKIVDIKSVSKQGKIDDAM